MRINGSSVRNYVVDNSYIRKMRAGYYMLGALLGKYHFAEVALPGGCTIGNRPIDLHLSGLKRLNAEIEEQGGRIVGKLKGLASAEGRRMLDRRLEVQRLYHSGSFEQTAYALDSIERALDGGWKLSYVQERRAADGSRETRRQRGTGNEVRVVDPVEYVYSAEGYYYLIVLDPTSRSGTKTPRIDRMTDVEVLYGQKAAAVPASRKAEILEGFRLSFGMFESRPVRVTLDMKAEHVKSVADRFGQSARFVGSSSGRGTAEVEVGLSDVFYGWVAQFAGEVAIASPAEAVEGMRAFLRRNLEAYGPDDAFADSRAR